MAPSIAYPLNPSSLTISMLLSITPPRAITGHFADLTMPDIWDSVNVGPYPGLLILGNTGLNVM